MLALDHVEQGVPRRRRGAARRHASRSATGDQVAVVGPSGSGKTTMLTILGTLERPTQRRGPRRWARRREGVGPRAGRTARPPDRVRVPEVPPPGHDDRARQRRHRACSTRGSAAQERREAARAALERVGLGHRLDPPAAAALGRRAPAGRDRAGARQAAGDHPRRRADRQPRLEVGRRGRGAAARAGLRRRDAGADHPRSRHRRGVPAADPDARRRDRRRRAADEHRRAPRCRQRDRFDGRAPARRASCSASRCRACAPGGCERRCRRSGSRSGSARWSRSSASPPRARRTCWRRSTRWARTC